MTTKPDTSADSIEELALYLEERSDIFAATTLRALLAERDHWHITCSGQGKLISSGVFVPNDEYVALMAERDALQQELDKVVGSMPPGSPEFMRAMAASVEERFARKLGR